MGRSIVVAAVAVLVGLLYPLAAQKPVHAVAALAQSGAHTTSSTPVGVLGEGTRWSSEYYSIDSGHEGPTVLIVAGIHGDERAPPLAARRLVEWRIARGRLVIVPEANRPALRSGTRHSPGARFPDLNRNFPTAKASEPRGELAPELWRLTVDLQPSWVLDLHEGWGFNHRNRKTMGSSVVVVPDFRVLERTRPLADRLRLRINETIADRTKRFTIIAPGPAGSFARSVTERLGIPSFVFETTRVSQTLELRVAQQLLLVRETLDALGMEPRSDERGLRRGPRVHRKHMRRITGRHAP
jgi:predicted deacylase